jgi:hypothetical protein
MASNTFPKGSGPFETDTLDIFCGKSDRDAVWRDAVIGLQNARRRMQELYAEEPGEYFIFDTKSRTILDQVGSLPEKSRSKPARSGAA